MEFVSRGHDLSQVTTFEELGKKAATMEIEHLQLALGRSFPELPSEAMHLNPGFGSYVKRTLAKENVDVAILSCYINMIHPDLKVREAALKKFEAYLRNARYFGASMVASETGNVHEKMGFTPDNFSDAPFLDLIQVIRRLVACGEKNNTLVAIEPGLNHPLYSLDRVDQLLAAIPSEHLGIILDATNLIDAATYKQQISLVKESFERFGDKIVAFHLKDYQIQNNKVVPVNMGEGVICAKEILDIIASYKPHCFVVLEETKDDALKKAVLHFRK